MNFSVLPGSFATRNTFGKSSCLLFLVILCVIQAHEVTATQQPSTSTLIPRGSVWKYHNLNIDLGTAVRQLDYDDSTWASGPGPLGAPATDTYMVTIIR